MNSGKPAIGFVGLGVMGRPMTSHLAAAGHAMTLIEHWQAAGRDAGAGASVSELVRWVERTTGTEITAGATP